MSDTAGPDVGTLFDQHDEALGGRGAIERVGTIRAVAACTGPTGDYETEVISTRDGRLYFRQRHAGRPDFTGIVNGPHAWSPDPESGAPRVLAPPHVQMLRGHEFQMIPLTLRERYSAPDLRGPTALDGRPCQRVRGESRDGGRHELYFDDTDHRLRAIRQTRPDGAPIVTYLEEWRRVGDVTVPRKIRVTDPSGEFVLDFHTIERDGDHDTRFAIPPGLAGDADE